MFKSVSRDDTTKLIMPCDTIMRFKAIKQFQAETFFSKSNNIDTKFLKDEITDIVHEKRGP